MWARPRSMLSKKHFHVQENTMSWYIIHDKHDTTERHPAKTFSSQMKDTQYTSCLPRRMRGLNLLHSSVDDCKNASSQAFSTSTYSRADEQRSGRTEDNHPGHQTKVLSLQSKDELANCLGEHKPSRLLIWAKLQSQQKLHHSRNLSSPDQNPHENHPDPSELAFPKPVQDLSA